MRVEQVLMRNRFLLQIMAIYIKQTKKIWSGFFFFNLLEGTEKLIRQ